jgi:outer membrane receptor protein involved in Fe transport
MGDGWIYTYGSDAIGGAMNFQTKKARTIIKFH